MNRITNLTVTISAAGRTHTLAAAELEALLGVELRPTLLRLVLDSSIRPQPVHEEEGGKGVEGASPLPGTVTVLKKPFGPIRTVRGRDGGLGEGRGATFERDAAALADALGDLTSLAFFRRVVATTPPELVREALTAALDVPRRDLRISRGAYFTAVLRRLRGPQP